MFQLTEEQEKLVKEAVNWYRNSSEQVFQYSGKAGTGKSVVMRAIIDRLGLREDEVAPMSYIGAAAIVMRTKGMFNAKTIHSWLYEPVIDYDYTNIDPYFNRPRRKLIFVPKPLVGKKLICIDEAGSVPMKLKLEIESRGVKVIACGDLNQLPPVADNPAYLYSGKVRYLNQIMRQAQNSAIVYLADRILQGRQPEPGFYGNVLVITRKELNNSFLTNADVIICGKNATREKLNRKMRTLVGIPADKDTPGIGEKIICRKNNWQLAAEGINLANGLTGTVYNAPEVYKYDGDTYEIDFKPNMFDAVFHDLKCSYPYFNCSYQDKELFKNGTFKSKGELFELGYAITTHISQGSQFVNGLYISEYMHEDINRNLDYTGITRFSNSCVYVLRW